MNCATRSPANPPLQRYSFETVALMEDRLKDWEQQCYNADPLPGRQTVNARGPTPALSR